LKVKCIDFLLLSQRHAFGFIKLCAGWRLAGFSNLP
jgi:hypothetical protein